MPALGAFRSKITRGLAFMSYTVTTMSCVPSLVILTCTPSPPSAVPIIYEINVLESETAALWQ